MASKTALPIARLRSLGCRVTTVLGHDPAIGDWIYGVTLPDGIELPLATSKFFGLARADSSPRVDRARVTVKACLYRTNEAPDQRARRLSLRPKAEGDVAGLLNAIADALSKAS